jgi:aminoglycoside 6-adenylyltransferase
MTSQLPPGDVLSALITWGRALGAIRAMLLTSTRAIPGYPVDSLSDFDVILAVDAIEPFHTRRAWVEHFGRLLVAYWDPIHPDPDYGHPVFGNVIQYAAGHKIDFTLWPAALLCQVAAAPELPAELDAGYRVLLDKDGLAQRLAAPTLRAYRPTLPDAAEFGRWVEEFLSDAPYVAKCLRRGELLPAKWALDFDMKHVYLRRVLEWRVVLESGGAARVGALGQGLSKHLPPDLWPEVERAYAGGAIEDNLAALLATLDVFGRAAREVGARLGFGYPDPMEAGVRALVDRIRRSRL